MKPHNNVLAEEVTGVGNVEEVVMVRKQVEDVDEVEQDDSRKELHMHDSSSSLMGFNQKYIMLTISPNINGIRYLNRKIIYCLKLEENKSVLFKIFRLKITMLTGSTTLSIHPPTHIQVSQQQYQTHQRFVISEITSNCRQPATGSSIMGGRNEQQSICSQNTNKQCCVGRNIYVVITTKTTMV